MDWLLEPLRQPLIVNALIASALVGVVCAVVGTYVVLRGIAFIGDAIAHAAALSAGRDRLDQLATTLQQRETLDEADARRAAGF